MLKILRIASIFFSAVLVILPLSGCGKKQTNRFSSAAMGSLPESMPQDLTQSSIASNSSSEPARLKLEDTDYKSAELKNYETTGAQFFFNQKEYYRIASAIYNYRDYHNTFIFDQNFMNIQQADPALLVEIAVSQAPQIDQYSSDFLNLPADSRIGKWVQKNKEDGFPISLIAYGDVVRAEAKILYGETYELPGINGKTIRYDENLDLYYLDREDASLATDYPVIIEEVKPSEKDNTIAVKAITLCYWEFNGIWSASDGSWESGGMSMAEIKKYLAKQIEAKAKQFVPSTYYLQEEDGVLRVTGYQKG